MLPDAATLWTPISTDGLPPELISSFESRDWARVRELVGVATRGVYGRQILQLRARLPLGVDPVLSQHRGWSAVSSGDWDDLERCLASELVDRAELAGLRDVILAPLDGRVAARAPSSSKTYPMLGSWEFAMNGAVGRYRRLIRQMLGWRSDPLALERGVPATRHARYRLLQERFLLALLEGMGGRLDVAATLALEAERLGDEGDVLRVLAADLQGGTAAARGGRGGWALGYPDHLATSHGQPPLDAAAYLLMLAPFIALRADNVLDWAAGFTESIAIRFGSPRLLLQAETWKLAARIRAGDRAIDGTAALLVKARRAGAGLRCLPLLIHGIASARSDALIEAEREARRAGTLWVQVSALTCLAALNPDASMSRRLVRLLLASGWRRPALVPSGIAADAALGMTSTGIRGIAPIELALASGRPNVTYEVARRHLEDTRTDEATRRTAVAALAEIGTTHARELLHRLARHSDPAGRAAAEHLVRSHPTTLSEREVEVLDLTAHGLTNREIGEKLSLSPHTVARHLANARAKLGAANRAEAVAKLGDLTRR